MSPRKRAEILDVPPNRLYQIIQIISGKRELNADTVRLDRYLGTSDEFWLNLQTIRHGGSSQLASS